MDIDLLLRKIKDCAYNVRLELGKGFLESVYHKALLLELHEQGLSAESEVPIKVYYKDVCVGDFKADILVEKCVILEIKACQALNSSHESQLANYLTATHLKYGVLINYGGDKFQFHKKDRDYRP